MPDATARLNAALSGRYRVERQLGEGGMATVYLADDLRHGRKVALKVLKPELAAVVGAERFLAEIRTTASLHHPHILPLFDSGEADGLLFYVMPRVEGESLRERLDRERQLPVDESIRIVTNVAEALDYAHRHDVIHRDIKPANILLLDGKPLVSDFGIALAVAAGSSARMTETGLSLGTPHYMSPEQATGDQSVGPATDIWALGCVLYETLLGEPPYTGSTPQAILGKIITAESPSACEVRKSVPPNVDATIRKALEKVPADRFRSAGELARALLDTTFGHHARSPTNRPGRRRWTQAVRPSVAATILVALLSGAVLGAIIRGPAEPRFTRGRYFNITLPDSLPVMFVGEHWTGNGETAMTLSPDARQLVYVGPAGSTTRLYVRSLDDPEVRPLNGTEGAHSPAFSRDGASVAFFAGGRLLRVSPDGGPVQPIAPANLTHGPPTWSPDGRIAFSAGDGRFLRTVRPGGSTETVLEIDPSTRNAHWVSYTEWILMSCGTTPPHICAVSSTGELVWLTIDGPPVGVTDGAALLAGEAPRFLEPGYLLFTAPARNALMGVRLDPETLRIQGEPILLVEGIRKEAWGSVQIALSEAGDLVLARGGNAGISTLVWVTGETEIQPLPFPPSDYGAFWLSDGDRRVAIRIYTETGDPELWFLDLSRGPPGLSGGATVHLGGLWLPRSDRFVARFGDSIAEIDARSPRGFALARSAIGLGSPIDVAADGSILFVDSAGTQSARARIMTGDPLATLPQPAGAETPSIAVPGLGTLSSLSPDGRWLAYTATTEDTEGQYEVYALRLDGASRPIRVSAGAGETPRWSPRGDRLFYRSGRRFYWVPFTQSANEPFGDPQLFVTGSFNNIPGPELEVSADGTGLLLLQTEPSPETNTLDYIEGFRFRLEELLGTAARPAS